MDLSQVNKIQIETNQTMTFFCIRGKFAVMTMHLLIDDFIVLGASESVGGSGHRIVIGAILILQNFLYVSSKCLVQIRVGRQDVATCSTKYRLL